MSFMSRVLDALGAGFRDRSGPMLELLVDGLTTELERVDVLIQPAPGGWPTLFDLDTTPQPAWLGTITGTTVPPGLTLEEQRAYVRDRAAWRRGSLDAIAAAIRTLLTDPASGHVGVIERPGGNAWHLQILVYDDDTTATAAQILAAAATQKPVGLILDGVTLLATVADPDNDFPGVTWWKPHEQVTTYARLKALAPTYADSAAMFPTYADARDHSPNP